jgi:hypothetical protein
VFDLCDRDLVDVGCRSLSRENLLYEEIRRFLQRNVLQIRMSNHYRQTVCLLPVPDHPSYTPDRGGARTAFHDASPDPIIELTVSTHRDNLPTQNDTLRQNISFVKFTVHKDRLLYARLVFRGEPEVERAWGVAEVPVGI